MFIKCFIWEGSISTRLGYFLPRDSGIGFIVHSCVFLSLLQKIFWHTVLSNAYMCESYFWYRDRLETVNVSCGKSFLSSRGWVFVCLSTMINFSPLLYPRCWEKSFRRLPSKNRKERILFAVRLDGNYTRMLHAILIKSWKQHSIKQQLYDNFPSVS